MTWINWKDFFFFHFLLIFFFSNRADDDRKLLVRDLHNRLWDFSMYEAFWTRGANQDQQHFLPLLAFSNVFTVFLSFPMFCLSFPNFSAYKLRENQLRKNLQEMERAGGNRVNGLPLGLPTVPSQILLSVLSRFNRCPSSWQLMTLPTNHPDMSPEPICCTKLSLAGEPSWMFGTDLGSEILDRVS